ncbi:MAG: Fic family protein [Gammaproteobacteria bacterium]|nr:Fic family protein [Gammaproteobacteria bacterium]MDE0479867.1 Fic family protein [Gammaproteobacteria bacterium]MXY91285.1 Fic family protein [Gammaproteobacteria bacterium]MYG95000.1 Fic family protein [Gammaproteobacteria bacterium]
MPLNQHAIQPLPPDAQLETVKILKKLPSVHRYLAELKGEAKTIPNEQILINTLTLQEAKASSEIENIITTHDELYKATLFPDYFLNPAAKEVSRYVTALKTGFNLIRQDRMLTVNRILQIHRELEQNDSGLRKLPGTVLRNEQSGEVVYTPPQDLAEIVDLMSNLEQFINDPDFCDADPLVKMAVIHYQFESIHPFYDGNGRTGRIINILYLVIQRLLDIPVLYLSRYIIEHKSEYYALLQSTRETGDWEDWILFMLIGIETTAIQTLITINNIGMAMLEFKQGIRSKLPKIYSQDLLNNLFRHPYTKIESIQQDLAVTRPTATKYLNQLIKHGFLEKHKIGRYNYYVNRRLFDLFSSPPDAQPGQA